MMTTEQWLIVLIGIIGCLLIYIWQHRKRDTVEMLDEVDEVNKTLDRYKENLINMYYNEYLETLLGVADEDIITAMESWTKAINMIDEHLPFFKTGYLKTLVYADDRYLKLMNEVSSDINKDLDDLRDQLQEDKKDLDLIADKTVIILRWFRKRVEEYDNRA